MFNSDKFVQHNIYDVQFLTLVDNDINSF